ncbi:MAG: winged helix-turn-helix domain-containing protein, partial [Candidatus Hermodarchaeota archaeon]|nr:winged helix-turn-helix domain-containing protein [Candidatus Hermodarchaeota archaeon]
MDEPIKLDDIRATVQESKEDLARTLRAVAHPKRLEVLTLLTDATRTFVELLKVTEISRTALANHLQHLITRGLIVRLERGSYQITKDGQELLQAVVEAYVDSQIRLSNGRRRMMERYAKTRTGMGRKMTKLNGLEFKDYAVSHLGALHGCLEYLDIQVTKPWLYGITAQGFLINIASGDLCPSGPTAWKPMPLFLGAKNLGADFNGVMAWPQADSEAEYAKKRAEAWKLVMK